MIRLGKLLGLLITDWDVTERERQSWRWWCHFHHQRQCLCSSSRLCVKRLYNFWEKDLAFWYFIWWVCSRLLYKQKKVILIMSDVSSCLFVLSGTYNCLHEWTRDCTMSRTYNCLHEWSRDCTMEQKNLPSVYGLDVRLIYS